MSVLPSAAPTTVEYFEAIYSDAAGDIARIPWANGTSSPALVNWLNAVAPSLVRCGARVAVVGCGLGEDARELLRRGYDVTAFDCSDTAVQWARRSDPVNANSYVNADLFDPPPRWRHRFDLVTEVNTLTALTPDLRSRAMGAIADLVSPHGHLLVIGRGAEKPVEVEAGPPWALTEQELLDAAASASLHLDGQVSSFMDDEDPPVHRLRAVFRRR